MRTGYQKIELIFKFSVLKLVIIDISLDFFHLRGFSPKLRTAIAPGALKSEVELGEGGYEDWIKKLSRLSNSASLSE